MKKRITTARDKGAAERDVAQTLGIKALAFLAADPERIGRFLALSGIGPGDLRHAAQEPLFLAGVLEHICSDERMLLDFAAEMQIKPDAVERAQAALGGRWERDIP